MNADSSPTTNMKVNLIDYTNAAADKLIYTKATRLTLGEETRSKLAAMTEEEKSKELAYMATTIPSSWEFVTYTFEILDVSRAFTHQFVRTRTGSYAQQTMRMLNMEKFNYVVGPTIEADEKRKEVYDYCMDVIQATYDRLIDLGAEVEDARGVLPTNICTNIIAQFSLRGLADMAKARTGGRTQNEYRRVVNAMITEVIAVHPWAEQFLFPDTMKHVRDLENMIEDLASSGKITKEERVKALKTFDMVKKGAK
jgi:flavin-dependent thymidylate synthase